MKLFLTLLAAILCAVTTSSATIIYTMDFSNAGEGSTHDNTGGDPLESSPVLGTNWELTFGSPQSDSTTNEFITVGGLMRVQDWGGDGTVTSESISITGDGSVDIVGVGSTIGTDIFNTSSKGITWFYILNSGTPVVVLLDETALGGSAVGSGEDIGNTFSSVAVLNGDDLEIGFTVNVNGADDGVEIMSLNVDFTPVPEPTIAVLGGLGLICLLRRRR